MTADSRVQTPALIFHLAHATAWQAAQAGQLYAGTDADRADGFIHFSTAAQVAASAAKHRPGARDLLLVGVDPLALGDDLRWEPARGGDLFPHLYAPLPLSAVRLVVALPLGADGRHVFPPDLGRMPPS